MTVAPHLPSARSPIGTARSRPELQHQIRRHELHREENAERDDHKVVQVPDDRYEVRDQVDWAEGIGRDSDGRDLRVPRHARVPRSEIQRVDVAFDLSRPSSEPLPYGDVGSRSNHWYSVGKKSRVRIVDVISLETVAMKGKSTARDLL
jgi:hypothetical protein